MKIIILTLLLVITLKASAQIQQASDFQKVKTRCRELLLSDTAYATEQSYRVTDDIMYDTDASGYLKRLIVDGSWSDLDYESKLRSSWKPSWHLYRVMLLCRAYYKTGDRAYLEATHRALAFWIKHDFQCSNWWQNQINVPFAYSSLMIMLDNEATAEELSYLNEKLINRMIVFRATGQNLIWQYDNQARIALLHGDAEGFNKLIKGIQQLITVSDAEGIQPDYSFHQHGAMLQFGNYGLHFLNSTVFWMGVTTNTGFAFTQDKQNVLFNYCNDGLRWTIFNGAMDITGTGRQIRNNYTLKRGEDLQADFALVRRADADKDACKYVLDGLHGSSIKNCVLTGNKNFWRSDYMIDMSASNYMMSVRTHGNGVKKVEAINGENLKGSYLNDGVTLIQHSGMEYRNIEPLWNWAMLPGTTCDTTTDPAAKNIFGSSNDNSGFVGQVSNGKEGISTMRYNRLGVKATKSYFFIDGAMIALGADISGIDKNHVVTTLDQCFYYGGDARESGKTRDGRQWFLKGGIAYWSLDTNQEISSRVEQRKGRWSDIDQASDGRLISDSVITLFISHRKSDHYAYAIKPAVNAGDIKLIVNSDAVNVIANTKDVQAISSEKSTLVAFIKAGSVKAFNKELIVDQPCLIICKKEDAQITLWISDPSRKANIINVKFGKQTFTAKLLNGMEAGSTVLVE